MSNEQLLTPRVIVQHLYPGCPFEVGEILTFRKDFMHRTDGTEESTTHSDVYKGLNRIVLSADIDRSIDSGCNAFRRLKWWEYRAESELPTYIKYVSQCEIKIIQVGSYYTKHSKLGFRKADSTYTSTLAEGDLPATLDEYNEYLNKQSNG